MLSIYPTTVNPKATDTIIKPEYISAYVPLLKEFSDSDIAMILPNKASTIERTREIVPQIDKVFSGCLLST